MNRFSSTTTLNSPLSQRRAFRATLWLAIGFFVAAPPAHAQSPPVPKPFDVAAIKPNKSGSNNTSMGISHGRLFEIIRTRDAATWPRWLEEAQNSPLASFARRLRRDEDAVEAALGLPWSNGMVEGQIHRLKLLKRQMCGRAGFDLLRQRVLQPA